MRTIEDRLRALSTTPAPPPPGVDELQARAHAGARRRRRHRASIAAGALAVLVVVAVVGWPIRTGTDPSPDIIAGSGGDEPTVDACDGATPTAPAGPNGPAGDRASTEDPAQLACLALRYYGNEEPPAAVRLGRVDTVTFQDWQREYTGGIGSVNGPAVPDTVTVLLVRASGGALWAPRPRAGSSEQLRGDTIYVVFTDGLSPDSVGSSGTGTWSEILANPWAQKLESVL